MTDQDENSPAVPDTAMATGNDEWPPGTASGEATLKPDERALLDNLRHDDADPVIDEAE
jgi:hypothetical protein